jgi:hypothetical protein
MKTTRHLVMVLLLLWSCTAKNSEIQSQDPNDSDRIDSTEEAATEAPYTESDSASNEVKYLTAEEVYGDVGEDFTGDMPDREDILMKDDVVHFVDGKFSDSPFPVALFESNDNAEKDVPEFLRANQIKFTVEKIPADPDSDESTDVYTYTFGESIIEIAYNTVTSALIYSPAVELEAGVKVGMTKDDFITRFTYLQEYRSGNRFQLHTHSLTSACYWQFDFENEKVARIQLKIFIQDCG